MVARYLLTVLILAPCIAGHFLYPAIVQSMRDSFPIMARVLVTVAVVQFVPYFLTGFVAFAFLRYIFHKMGLDNADAIGKEFDSQKNHFVQDDIMTFELQRV